MRKVLIGTLIGILLIVFTLSISNGIKIGNISLGHPLKEIINANRELDNGIAALSSKIETEYKQIKASLEESFTGLQNEKQEYQDRIAYTSSEDLTSISESEKYKLDYIWTNIGLYATKNNLAMKAELTHGSSGVPDEYNISFTVHGDYMSISDFIYAIEKDPNLGFRIEEFALVPYSEDKLQGTFIIKNVAIVKESISNSATIAGSENDETNTANENTASENTIQPAVDVPRSN